ncbi:MAG: MmgE/PrpD family protein, partial [Dehalococcoidia bacterium]|nr:MmgE/PrpD family protein [Dehalococcoidia bacterium]
MDKTQEKISTYAAKLSVKDITPQALHAVKRSLIDSIGCALGAFSVDSVQVVRRVASRVTSTAPATLIGTDTKTSPDLAAFVNGTMVRYLDFSDDYVKKDGPHPSDSLPAVLAMSEALHADGKTFACGLTLAYEIIDRMVDSANFMFRGYDYAPEHSMGSALGCGKVLGLSSVQMAHALSLAIVPNIALGQTRKGNLSMWKACAGPNAARNGLFAALLASEGMAGPNDPIEGPFGLWNKVTGPFELMPFGGGGRSFEIEQTFFKYRQVVYTALLPVEIAIELHDKVDIDAIDSLTIFVHRRPVGTKESPEDPEKWDPKTR